MEDKTNAYTILLGKLKWKHHLVELEIYIIKMDLQ